jgi:hypothetical protein
LTETDGTRYSGLFHNFSVHGLALKFEKDSSEAKYGLFEDHASVKYFTKEEVESIKEGKMDPFTFFKKGKESLEKAEKVLRGREKSIGFDGETTEMKEKVEEVRERVRKMKEEKDIKY